MKLNPEQVDACLRIGIGSVVFLLLVLVGLALLGAHEQRKNRK